MADNPGARVTAGDFVGGVGQNIVANICASAIGAGCVAVGLTQKADLADPTNWKLWLLAAGVALVGVFGGNTVRLGIGRLAARSAVRKASGERIALMIARLDGDDRGARRAGLRDQIKRELGEAVHITLWPETLRVGEGRDADAEARAHKTAQAWLKRKNCDLLVWGAVQSDKTTTLRFTSRDDAGQNTAYALSADTMEIPQALQADLATAVVARVATEAAPAYDGSRFIAPLLRELAGRIEPLAHQMKPGLARGEVWRNYGAVLMRIGMQAGTVSDLTAAIAAFREALKAFDKDHAPVAWAVTQTNMALTLKHLGEIEQDVARLKEAVAVHREALEALPYDHDPLLWATTLMGFANALRTLAEMERDAEGLREAVTLHRRVVAEFSRERAPLNWAQAKHNLAAALSTLARLNRNVNLQKEGVAAYREALEERTRDRVPLYWALTQNNLGLALESLGEWRRDKAYLEQAVTAFREALEERTRDRVPMLWARTQNNLGCALLSLGEWERGSARLIEAVTAFQAALEEFTEEAAPYSHRLAQNNLDRAREVARRRLGGPRPSKPVEPSRAPTS